MLEDHREVAPLVFYRRLFELDPPIRALIKTDIAEQARLFMDWLGVLITHLDRPAALAAELRDMGAWPVGGEVEERHLTAVKEALLDMLSQTLGAAFTPEARQAWDSLFGKVEAALRSDACAGDLSPA